LRSRNTRAIIVSAMIAAMLLLPALPGAVLADEPTADATRSIDLETIGPGGTVEVTVEFESLLGETEGFALVEHIPAGWEFESIDAGGADPVKVGAETIEWLWLTVEALGSRTVVYTLTAPDDAAEDYPITGVVKAAGVDNPVLGDEAVTVATVTAEAMRSIDPHTIAPGGTVEITVEFDSLLGYEDGFGMVEQIPAGWEFESIEADGADPIKVGEETIEWLWLTVEALGSRTVVYTLTAPVDAAEADYPIDGVVKAAGVDNDILGDDTITVEVEVPPVEEYTVTVVSYPPGAAAVLLGAGVYETGETVEIEAADFAHNFNFDEWTSVPAVQFADETAAATTFTMPAHDVAVTARLGLEPDTWTVTLVADPDEGSVAFPGETLPIGAFSPEDIVTITATPNPGFVFVEWTTSPPDVDLDDSFAEETSFEMRALDVIITAHFEAEEPVGGTVYPANTLAVVAPWLALAAAIAFGAILIRRRRAQS